MTDRTKSERILQHLVDATRSLPAPTVDFERLQSTVRRAWISNQRERQQPALHWRWASAVAVAVSFFIGGWYGHAHHQGARSTDAEKQASMLPLDGRALIQGQELEAGREPLVVNHPGVAKWTLAPGGKARLASKGAYLTIQLDVGRLEADVIPSTQPESFAVEVGALRVAVHGTSFTVNKGNDTVEVAVTSGTVVVGSRGNPGHTEGSLLHAPDHQWFSAESAPSLELAPIRSDPATGSSVRSKVSGSANAPSASNESAPTKSLASAEVSLSEHPARVEIETAVDAVRAAAARCFAEAKGGDPSHESRVMVRVDTELTVSIAPSGSISDTVFAPPIPNAIWECTRREVANFATSPSKLGAAASRVIMLTR